jgi:4'-phosphopantetheinyl transferase
MMTAWQNPTQRPSVSMRTVHIWRIRLGDPHAVERLAPVLSADERARAERFHRPEDRTAFIITRGTVRELLGGYLSLPAAAVRLQYSQTGKPSLVENDGLYFNVSHSGSLALLALSARPVGIDVELIKPDFDWMDISGRFFSQEEISELSGSEAGLRVQRFFSLWTRKEALLKATGAGVPGLEAGVEQVGWNITEIDAAPGYAAAVAHKGEELNLWHWQSDEVLIG